MILAIDPGTPAPACAYFWPNGELAGAVFAERPGGSDLTAVVIERLEFHGHNDTERMPALLAMMRAGDLAAGHALGQAGMRCVLVDYTPRQWKNNEPKARNHARLWKILTPAEHDILGGGTTGEAIERAVERCAERRWPAGFTGYPRSFTRHNLLCAVALGCAHLGRLRKR